MRSYSDPVRRDEKDADKHREGRPVRTHGEDGIHLRGDRPGGNWLARAWTSDCPPPGLGGGCAVSATACGACYAAWADKLRVMVKGCCLLGIL